MDELRSDRVRRFADMHVKARSQANKSQEFMSLELGVSKKTVQNWEKGISSPSFFQSLEWFRILRINPFPFFLSYIYPEELERLRGSDDDATIEKAFDKLVESISIQDKRAIMYLYYGRHGSSPHSVIQLFLAHLHTPIKSRVITATLIWSLYSMEKDLDNIICPDNILPDMVDLGRAIHQAQLSAVEKSEGYINYENSKN